MQRLHHRHILVQPRTGRLPIQASQLEFHNVMSARGVAFGARLLGGLLGVSSAWSDSSLSSCPDVPASASSTWCSGSNKSAGSMAATPSLRRVAEEGVVSQWASVGTLSWDKLASIQTRIGWGCHSPRGCRLACCRRVTPEKRTPRRGGSLGTNCVRRKQHSQQRRAPKCVVSRGPCPYYHVARVRSTSEGLPRLRLLLIPFLLQPPASRRRSGPGPGSSMAPNNADEPPHPRLELVPEVHGRAPSRASSRSLSRQALPSVSSLTRAQLNWQLLRCACTHCLPDPGRPTRRVRTSGGGAGGAVNGGPPPAGVSSDSPPLARSGASTCWCSTPRVASVTRASSWR
jgi:hypothetical protein